MDKRIPIIAAAAAAGAGSTVLGLAIWHDMHYFVTRRYAVRSPKIRKDTRLVVLADLHDQVYGRHNERLLDAIDALHPDLVVSVGDLITASFRPATLKGEESTALLMTLARRYPTIVLNGNHETKLDEYSDKYGSFYDDYEAMVSSAGALILRNEAAKLADRGICVTGLELPTEYFGHILRKPLPEERMRSMIGTKDPVLFNLLLAHHPDYFPEYAAWGADLVLSGHIHGGIIRLPRLGGVIAPTWHLFPKYDGGRFTEGDSTMILSRGLGTHTIPVRLGNPGELVVVDLAGEEAAAGQTSVEGR